MSETTYNFTIPHTSPLVWYENANAAGETDVGWYTDCPVQNGVPVCGDSSGNVQGNRFTNLTATSFEMDFYGRSIYIYGDADPGMTLTLTINTQQENQITLTPSNGLLASIDDWTVFCTYTYDCRDWADDPLGNTNHNHLQVSATQSITGAKMSFSKAVFAYPTDHTGASVSLKTYNSSDPAIQYSIGWSLNGTYMQSGIQATEQFTLSFDGEAIWIWEFCGQRSSTDWGDYGEVSINGGSNTFSTFSGEHLIQDGKCLAFFQGKLFDTGNTLTFNSEIYNCQIHSIDVLQVSGGSPYQGTSTDSGSNPTGVPEGQGSGTSKVVLIAVPVVAICVAVVAGIIIAVLVHRSRGRSAVGKISNGMNNSEPQFTPQLHTQGYAPYDSTRQPVGDVY